MYPLVIWADRVQPWVAEEDPLRSCGVISTDIGALDAHELLDAGASERAEYSTIRGEFYGRRQCFCREDLR